jgi:hypothetical protein
MTWQISFLVKTTTTTTMSMERDRNNTGQILKIINGMMVVVLLMAAVPQKSSLRSITMMKNFRMNN